MKYKNKEQKSIVKRIAEKENVFMERYRPYLQGIYEELDIPLCNMEISDLETISQRLFDKFFGELLEDEDFLNMEIKEHFRISNGTHVFCLEIVNIQEPCECCGNLMSEWLALIINKEKHVLDFGFMKCNSVDRVEDSLYCGCNVYYVLDVLDSDEPFIY